MATYSSIQVLPVTDILPKNQITSLGENDRSSKESVESSGENIMDEDKNAMSKCSPKTPLPCGSRRSDSTCISVADEESAQVGWILNIDCLRSVLSDDRY